MPGSQDRGEQRDDRPRGGALSRRLHEVPWGSNGSSRGCRTARSVRRRGERGRLVPARGRDGLEHRQGRADPRLLAAEMMATTGRDPGEQYAALTREFGAPVYERIDAPATKEQKAALSKLSPSQVTAKTLAGERIEAMLTTAPGTAPRSGAEGGHRERLVRRRPRGPRMSTSCTRELSRRGPPAENPGGGPGPHRAVFSSPDRG